VLELSKKLNRDERRNSGRSVERETAIRYWKSKEKKRLWPEHRRYNSTFHYLFVRRFFISFDFAILLDPHSCCFELRLRFRVICGQWGPGKQFSNGTMSNVAAHLSTKRISLMCVKCAVWQKSSHGIFYALLRHKHNIKESA